MCIYGEDFYHIILCHLLSWSIFTDFIDHDDSICRRNYRFNIRMDGSYYAIYGLSTKFGNAVGAGAGILIMTAFGYVANQKQTAEAMRGINITVNLIPAILLILAGIILVTGWNKSDAEFDEIRRRIQKEK